MKIYQLSEDRTGFILLHDFGDLKPFSEEFLLKQLKDVLSSDFGTSNYEASKLLNGKNSFLVFSDEERDMIMSAFGQICGNFVTDQGFGYGNSVTNEVINKIVKSYFNACLRYDFPKDLNPGCTLRELKPVLAISFSVTYE